LTQYSPKIFTKIPSAVSVLQETSFYLVRLYAHNQEALFGVITDGCFHLTTAGQIATDEWLRSTRTYPGLELDEWLVLPDRLEAIVGIQEPALSSSYSGRSGKPRLLSSFIASYKAVAAKRINLVRNAPGSLVWQRSYQERFIPDQASLERIRLMLQKQPTLP
jgi:hypothetical protein